MIVQAALGVVMAFILFGALLWSLYRAVTTRGASRALAICLGTATLLGMLAISFGWTTLALPLGTALTLLGLGAIWSDPGWSKLLPMAQAVFGMALATGLPWQGA